MGTEEGLSDPSGREWRSGGCHCGAVRFEVALPLAPELIECNCSICARTGYRHLIVDAHAFRLRTDRQALTTYSFGTGAAKHLFCATCGIKSFYMPRSHPDGVSVNARCLDVALDAPVRAFDGQNWEAARVGLG